MRLILVICFMLSGATFAADYKSAQRLAAGDVISADVFNNIIDHIELTLKPIQVEELDGDWDAIQIFCGIDASSSFGSDDYCHSVSDEEEHEDEDHGDGHTYSEGAGERMTGTTLIGNGLMLKREDIIKFVSNEDGTFSWTNAERDMMYMFNQSSRMKPNTGGLTHNCYIAPSNLVACRLDISMDTDEGALVNFMTVTKSSPTQLIFRQGPEVGSGSLNFVILNKRISSPDAPSSLSATLDSGSVSLSWTENDVNVTSYSIRSKDDAVDDFTELNTSSIALFTDVLEAGTSRWYRVFAVNAYGTSIGSNVIRVDNPES